MINLPLISIITVVLNGKETIEKTLNSVLMQNYENVEYIVIDGGSTDGTQDVVHACIADSPVPVLLIEEQKCNMLAGIARPSW